MPPLPDLTGNALLKLLLKMGFVLLRTKGAHHRLKHPDGRVTTVPVHGSQSLPKGLLRKIIREDLELDLDDFLEMIDK